MPRKSPPKAEVWLCRCAGQRAVNPGATITPAVILKCNRLTYCVIRIGEQVFNAPLSNYCQSYR